ncbi:unnamed protein product [Schistosoma mattheei]|uniref:Uncharacterized protein n=1 Tax=Schistosoma mattheei TaxID=31246 RepID=A0A183Q5B6_9TREM|nr:unnamed protein product [Schistosoma mattheei]
MQTKTASVTVVSASVGLSKHKGKTKVLKFKAENSNPVTLDVETLEDVESFTYLGSSIDEQGGSDADVKARIGKARFAFLQMKNNMERKRRKGEDRQSKGRIPTIEEHMELNTYFQTISKSQSSIRTSRQFYCMELKLGELQQQISFQLKKKLGKDDGNG